MVVWEHAHVLTLKDMCPPDGVRISPCSVTPEGSRGPQRSATFSTTGDDTATELVTSPMAVRRWRTALAEPGPGERVPSICPKFLGGPVGYPRDAPLLHRA